MALSQEERMALKGYPSGKRRAIEAVLSQGVRLKGLPLEAAVGATFDPIEQLYVPSDQRQSLSQLAAEEHFLAR